MTQLDFSTPVLLLGGSENALAVARNLGKKGVEIKIGGEESHIAMKSRYCNKKFIRPDTISSYEFWKNLLLVQTEFDLSGHILFACDDGAIEFLVEHRTDLENKYIIDDYLPDLHRSMLDKKSTLEIARSVNVATPNFWEINSLADVDKIRSDIVFPVMVKPIHSHKFQIVFDMKLFIIKADFDELLEKAKLALDNNLEIMIVEMIPGPDSLLCSYFTYIDKDDNHLYEHTKRTPRRFPVNRGGGSYHITEWIEETAELGRKFFTSIHYRGMANIEFKRDTRDGKLKVIEVNSRFTATEELFVKCKMPINFVLYCYLTNQPFDVIKTYEQNRRMWYPIRDYFSFREQYRNGDLTFMDWMRSIGFRRQVFPIFNIFDPWPFIVDTAQFTLQTLKNKFYKLVK